jgi:hypothetical protein
MTKAKVIFIKVIFITVLLTVLLTSCPFLSDLLSDYDLSTLGDNEFYAQNMLNEKFYIVKADLIFEGEKCLIWAEKGSNITPTQAKGIALEYDDNIQKKIVEAFSKKNFNAKDDSGKEHSFSDMLEYANWRVGKNDNKLTILLLDIKDGYKKGENNSYVAGYFDPNNFYQKGNISGTKRYSNGLDMIYVDTNPGLQAEIEQTYATLAHELQHLISYVTTVQMNRKSYLDTWVDEGLSSQAEYFYLGKNPTDKCEWFSRDRDGTIANGNNFFVWGNHKDKSMANYDDYATVYLFFRWLYLQASKDSRIFMDIETSSNYDYQAVTNAARQINSKWDNWETLLGTWLAANYYPKNTYGYTGDDYLRDTIKVKPIAAKTSVSLAPGEGVYSIMNNPFSGAVGGTNIRYAGLSASTSAINTASPYTGNILLTFNANTDHKKGLAETGSLTGVTLSATPLAVENTRTLVPESEPFKGPYVIDARDILGRDRR